MGAVAACRGAFDRADADLSAYVTTANDRFQQATASLAKIADPTYSALTPAQRAGIQDASAVANAKAAATAEKSVDDAIAALAQKEAVLDEKIREALSVDIDSDPSANANVVAAATDRDNASAQLATAKANYTLALQDQAAAWEALVPDSAWQLLWTFKSAQATLNWLQTPGPAALSAAMDGAEAALVTALLAADKSQRTIAALMAEAAEEAEIADYETAAAPSRRFSALRGDF